MTPSTTNRSPRVLLLDDDATALRLLGTALQARGCDVRAACDGAAGVALLLDELLDLDVVVTDAELPGRDARALLHLVRWAGGERDLGVVVLAPDDDAGSRDELLALGADAVVGRRAGLASAVEAIAAVGGWGAPPPARPGRPPARAGALCLVPGAPTRARAALAPA